MTQPYSGTSLSLPTWMMMRAFSSWSQLSVSYVSPAVLPQPVGGSGVGGSDIGGSGVGGSGVGGSGFVGGVLQVGTAAKQVSPAPHSPSIPPGHLLHLSAASEKLLPHRFSAATQKRMSRQRASAAAASLVMYKTVRVQNNASILNARPFNKLSGPVMSKTTSRSCSA